MSNVTACTEEFCAPDATDCAGYRCDCPPGYETLSSVDTIAIGTDATTGQVITATQTTYTCRDINECAGLACPLNSCKYLTLLNCINSCIQPVRIRMVLHRHAVAMLDGKMQTMELI